MNLLTPIKSFFENIETKKIYEELANRKNDLRRENMIKTLHTLTNYLIADMLESTGLLYRPDDEYIQQKVQKLFFEWKDEGIIDEFDDFTDETKNWILTYS